MKKTIKIVSIITLMILMLIQGSAYASFNITEASLYNKGDCGDLLKYKGALLYSSFVVYQKDGVEYPAYCLNANLPGVMESGPYTVTTNNLLTNQAIWRVIVNGYPYKTPQELGVANREEAFTATKQAVYCILYGNDANNFSGYTAVGAAGQRTLNALKQIVTAARNSNETKQSSNINITPNANKLEIDNINKNYLSITYNVSSYEIQGSYNVELTGKIPQNTLVTDVNNNSKNEFKQGEKFKILIPIQNLDSVGNFGISVKAAVKTKPVFYGKAPSTSLQDYAITATMVEEGVGTTTLN